MEEQKTADPPHLPPTSSPPRHPPQHSPSPRPLPQTSYSTCNLPRGRRWQQTPVWQTRSPLVPPGHTLGGNHLTAHSECRGAPRTLGNCAARVWARDTRARPLRRTCKRFGPFGEGRVVRDRRLWWLRASMFPPPSAATTYFKCGAMCQTW